VTFAIIFPFPCAVTTAGDLVEVRVLLFQGAVYFPCRAARKVFLDVDCGPRYLLSADPQKTFNDRHDISFLAREKSPRMPRCAASCFVSKRAYCL
jgi:hypothetical protein